MNTVKKKLKPRIEQVACEMGSNNVFADLEMPDAAEKLVKAELILNLNQIIKKRKLTQLAAAKILDTDQSKISLLNNGKLSVFSIERLVHYLNLLNQDVDIIIHKTKKRNHRGTFRVLHTESSATFEAA